MSNETSQSVGVECRRYASGRSFVYLYGHGIVQWGRESNFNLTTLPHPSLYLQNVETGEYSWYATCNLMHVEPPVVKQSLTTPAAPTRKQSLQVQLDPEHIASLAATLIAGNLARYLVNDGYLREHDAVEEAIKITLEAYKQVAAMEEEG